METSFKDKLDKLFKEYNDAYNEHIKNYDRFDKLRIEYCNTVLEASNFEGKCIRIYESVLDETFSNGTYIKVRTVKNCADEVCIKGYGFRKFFNKEDNIIRVVYDDNIVYVFNLYELEKTLEKITVITKDEFDSIFDKMIEDMKCFHQKQEEI